MKKQTWKAAVSAAAICVAAAMPSWAATVTLTGTDAANTTSFTSGAKWSDGNPPSSANDYVVASSRTIRSPEKFVTSAGVTTNAVFAGKSLTLGDGSGRGALTIKTTADTRYKGCASVTVDDLRLVNANSYVQHAGNFADTRLYGKITFTVPQNDVTATTVPYLTSNEDRYLDVYSELFAEAGCGFKVKVYDGTKTAHIALMTDSPSYLGYIAVEGGKAYLTAESTGVLGPNPATPTALLNLRGGGAFGVEYNDVTIDQPNRGIYVSSTQGGRLYAASGKMLLTSMFITGEATPRPVEKVGAGTVLVTGSYGAGDIAVSGGRLGLAGGVSCSVSVSSGCSFGPATADSTLTLSGALYLADGARLHIPLGSVVELTDGFMNSVWPLPCEFSGEWPTGASSVPAFRIASSVRTVSEDDFRSLTVLNDGTSDYAIRFEVATEGGVQTVSCVKSVIVRMKSTITGVNDNDEHRMLMKNPWDDGQVPQAGKTYIVGGNQGLRTNAGGLNGSVSFPGDELKFEGSANYSNYAKFLLKAKETTIPHLTVSGKVDMNVASYYGSGDHMEQILNGCVYIFQDSYFVVNSSYDRLLTWNSAFSGSGTVHIVPNEQDTSVIGKSNSHKNEMRVALTADNSAWTGNIIMSAKPDSFNGAVPTGGNDGIVPVELIIFSGNNIGGNPAAYNENAFRISAHCRLTATNTLELASPNRPIKVEHYAEMRVVDGETMTISSPLILNGTLTKTGAGTLALGTHAASSTTNKIVLSEGFLSATSTNGFNGVAVKMSPGTAIKVSLATDPATDLGRFGFFNVGANTPFDLSDTDGKLQIIPDDPGNLLSSRGKVVVNLLTVSTTTADLLEGNIQVSVPKGRRVKIRRLPADAAGRVTFTADIITPGMMLIVK